MGDIYHTLSVPLAMCCDLGCSCSCSCMGLLSGICARLHGDFRERSVLDGSAYCIEDTLGHDDFGAFLCAMCGPVVFCPIVCAMGVAWAPEVLELCCPLQHCSQWKHMSIAFVHCG
jgi:hypothetical protein